MKSKTHRISIPTILEIKRNAINELGILLNDHNFKDVLIMIDDYINNLIGTKLKEILKKENIKNEIIIISPTMEMNELTKTAYSISGDVDLVLGIGGGSVLDRAKYMCYLRKKVFISMPTAPSNDGFASPVSSLYVDNKRTTVPAKIPYGVIVDLDLIKDVPKSMLYSGIGDSISNITAVEDMHFENKKRGVYVDKFATMISRRSIDTLMAISDSDIRDYKFLSELMESLTMSGISMEIAGVSSPGSGSEHLISHALDKLLGKNNYPHGIQVGIATYLISVLQNNMSDKVDYFLFETGFWDYIKTLNIKKTDIEKAIDIAPSIKKYRVTYIHIEENRKKAKEILNTNKRLNDVLV